ncbi:Uncharacterised protein [BD1-7 clade bacterium]|uniref:Uncharacterized protein n=1 Tax=BD1-7 clade bacterium TaxID=2029982 RepID=A0A5S9NN77_9GAMM|nr:Uncharacterised protein [BD1-7 clade bacterium]
MTVMLHPNKTEPKRYRVFDRETGTQKYFPLTTDGRQAAEALAGKVKENKRFKQLQRDLGINKMFRDDGLIRGMDRKYRARKGYKPYEYFSLYANRKQTEITIDCRGFDDAYNLAVDWLMEQQHIEPTHEIKLQLRKTRKLYFRSVAPEGIQPQSAILAV